MQNNANQKTHFIYVRSTGEKVPVTKEQHDSFYKEADRMLLEHLFARLRVLDPDGDTIIQCWLDDYKISDRAIAEKLGRKQRTFADQMKKIRTELRKVRGH